LEFWKERVGEEEVTRVLREEKIGGLGIIHIDTQFFHGDEKLFNRGSVKGPEIQFCEHCNRTGFRPALTGEGVVPCECNPYRPKGRRVAT
jgi:hypothetical protein